jgi:hypothetical protein
MKGQISRIMLYWHGSEDMRQYNKIELIGKDPERRHQYLSV